MSDDPSKWREAGVNWARRAPESEVERLVERGRTGPGALEVEREEWPSLYTEIATLQHVLADDQPMHVDLSDPSLRAFVDGAAAVWDETHGPTG